MSKPITNVPTMPLPFEQRLKLVQAEIKNRVNKYPAKLQPTIRARLWVRWINKNILEVNA